MNIGVLVSGNGSNLQALIDAAQRGELAPAKLCVVVSNRPAAFALQRARKAGLATVVLDHTTFADRSSFEAALVAVLESHDVEGVVLAGFMRVLGPTFIDKFPKRIINTHPALLPSFPGMHAVEQALAYGVKVSGCTIHLVDAGVDTGPIIFQAVVEVQASDSPESLQRRIQALEHQLLPQAVQLLARGGLLCEGRSVHFTGP